MHINPSDSDEGTITLPLKKKYSKGEIDEFAADNTVGQLMFIAQAYLAKPLSSTDINCLLYMYDALKLSTDFIEYIMETSISDGLKSMSSIEKVAVNYYSLSITDIEAAKEYRRENSSLGRKVLKAFGITDRLPGKEEKSFILRWQDELGYGEDIIIEACNRTITHTHTPSFKYANTILSSWHKAGIRSIAEVQKADEAHAEEAAKKAQSKRSAGVPAAKHKGGHKISSHQYDFKELEKQLTTN